MEHCWYYVAHPGIRVAYPRWPRRLLCLRDYNGSQPSRLCDVHHAGLSHAVEQFCLRVPRQSLIAPHTWTGLQEGSESAGERGSSNSPRMSFVDGSLHVDASMGDDGADGGSTAAADAGALIARPHMQLATNKGALKQRIPARIFGHKTVPKMCAENMCILL